jgi:hypothetical protein
MYHCLNQRLIFRKIVSCEPSTLIIMKYIGKTKRTLFALKNLLSIKPYSPTIIHVVLRLDRAEVACPVVRLFYRCDVAHVVCLPLYMDPVQGAPYLRWVHIYVHLSSFHTARGDELSRIRL